MRKARDARTQIANSGFIHYFICIFEQHECIMPLLLLLLYVQIFQVPSNETVSFSHFNVNNTLNSLWFVYNQKYINWIARAKIKFLLNFYHFPKWKSENYYDYTTFSGQSARHWPNDIFSALWAFKCEKRVSCNYKQFRVMN